MDPNLIDQHGIGAATVLELTKGLPPNNYNIYFENYFTSLALLKELQNNGINAAGTARINWFQNPPLLEDKVLSKKTRATWDQATISDGSISTVKWLDTKCVTLASNFVLCGRGNTVKRYDKKNQRKIEITQPEVVYQYNNRMGGVDRFDQGLSYYRIEHRARKWT